MIWEGVLSKEISGGGLVRVGSAKLRPVGFDSPRLHPAGIYHSAYAAARCIDGSSSARSSATSHTELFDLPASQGSLLGHYPEF